MKWPSFHCASKVYDLAHLHPRTFIFERPTEGRRVAESYKVEVHFSLHCFTRDPRPPETADATLIYPDSYERRIFDFRRYELSKRLPEIIQSLPKRKPRHNGHRRNFFTIELINENEETIEYDVFFKMKKVARGRLEMIVESAFARDPNYGSTRPEGKPIRFWVILHNTLNEKPIHG